MKLKQIEQELLQMNLDDKRIWASPDEFLALLASLAQSANGSEQALQGINHGLSDLNHTLERVEVILMRNLLR